NYNLSAIKAFFKLGKALTFSKDTLKETEEKLLEEFHDILEEEAYNNSISLGDSIAATILKRSATDNYKLTRGMPKYTINSKVGIWQPTPPDYFDAVEPHWDIIKPFLLNSNTQFAPPPPPPFSLNNNSQYYKELMETYNVVKNSTPTQDTIARYWDDNAFVTQHDGHLTYASKKTTPPGHWMGIIAILSKQQKASEISTAKAYALAAAAMFDGFITCWTEKYKSKTVRPITVIQENIDRNWNPILQTPPFPEYISGHSVISSAAAGILSAIWGNNIAFTDTTEVQYLGLKRHFNTIEEVANEVSISRVYGGIHYRAAVVQGSKQGQKIGSFYTQVFK
ncbi:MAG: phosphatase PAP2 family protein, partial [Sphingobacteriia bacterium]